MPTSCSRLHGQSLPPVRRPRQQNARAHDDRQCMSIRGRPLTATALMYALGAGITLSGCRGLPGLPPRHRAGQHNGRASAGRARSGVHLFPRGVGRCLERQKVTALNSLCSLQTPRPCCSSCRGCCNKAHTFFFLKKKRRQRKRLDQGCCAKTISFGPRADGEKPFFSDRVERQIPT